VVNDANVTPEAVQAAQKEADALMKPTSIRPRWRK
jgi:hypothetical protein